MMIITYPGAIFGRDAGYAHHAPFVPDYRTGRPPVPPLTEHYQVVHTTSYHLAGQHHFTSRQEAERQANMLNLWDTTACATGLLPEPAGRPGHYWARRT